MSPAVAHSFTSSHSLGGLLNRVSIGSSGGTSGGGGGGGPAPSSWDLRPSMKPNGAATSEVASGLTLSANGSNGSPSSTFPPSPRQPEFSPRQQPAPASIRAFPPPLEPRSYTILKEVGDGSFGTVWLADWHSKLHLPLGTLPPGPSSRPEYQGKQLVAIKRMKKAFEGGWDECMKLKELKSLRHIPAHPNIIPLYDAFLLASTKELYFVFECMEGNLYQLTKSRKGRPLAAGLTASIFHQILEGLDHIHANGYFHRDMKPENLLITTTGLADYPASSLFAIPGTPPEKDVVVIVKLADFGLARETNSRPPYTEYVSTRWYRAPEVLLRARDYSNPVDMWALGTIMVETLTLRPLFPGDSEIDQVYKICELLGDPCPDYGMDERGQLRGGGPWNKGAQLAKGVGFAFPKMVPRSLSTLFDSSTVPSQLVDCLANLLRYEPKNRLTTRQCLNHAYFRDVAPRFAPAPTARSNGFSHPSSPINSSSTPSTATTRILPSSHKNGIPSYPKPPFQLTSPDPNRSSLLSDPHYSRDPLLRHQSVDSTVSGMSGYGMQIVSSREDGSYDSPMAFPENVGEGHEQFPSPAPSSVWNGRHPDPNWGGAPTNFHSHQQTQFQETRPAIPAFGTQQGRRGSFSSATPSVAASTFYDGSIFEGIAPIRPSSIMSVPISYSNFRGHADISPPPTFPDSPVMERESSQESVTPSVAAVRSEAQAASSKGRGWGFFSSDKVPTSPASAIIQRHAQAQAQQNANPLKRTPSNASTSVSYEASEVGIIPKAPVDPKKAKKEAEKLAKEAEKLKREMLQQASRERARAVMKKKNQLMEAADPLHNFSNHSRVIGADKAKARAPDRTATGASQSSKASTISSKMPQIVEDASRLHVGDKLFKARRRDDDDDVHSVSSNETGHSSQRERAFSISSQATSASDPQPRLHQYSDKSVPRVPSLSSLPVSSSSPHYYPAPPNTGHSSLDHQLIKNMQGLSAGDNGGWRSPARPQSRSASPREVGGSDARYSPYPPAFHPNRLSGQSLPSMNTFDSASGGTSHNRQASQASSATPSFHSAPSVLSSHFPRDDVPQLPYLPAMDLAHTPSPGLTFPYTPAPEQRQHLLRVVQSYLRRRQQAKMVPQPKAWQPAPDPKFVVDPNLKIEPTAPIPPLPYLRNTSGRPWKQPHGATVRSQKGDKSASNWDKRQEARKKDEAVKKLEKEMKDERSAEVERKRTITKERQQKAAEKLRLEEMAKRMSAKKLQRMKKRMGRTKKISA